MTTRTKRLLWLMSQKPKLRTFSGVPPLTFKAKKSGTLKNYRIYGNTVNGSSLGDRTKNLWDESYPDYTYSRYRPVYVGEGYFTLSTDMPVIGSDSTPTTNLFLLSGNVSTGASSTGNGVWNGHPVTQEALGGYVTVVSRVIYNVDPKDYHTQLEAGSTATDYVPYGYQIPIVVTNGTDTETSTIVLASPLSITDDVADYVDYKRQKRFNADGTSVDVTLPAIPTLSGTNTLSVGTEVQPSNIEITGKIKGVTA